MWNPTVSFEYLYVIGTEFKKMIRIIISFFLFLSVSGFGQDVKRGTIKVKKVRKDTVQKVSAMQYTRVTRLPAFTGGQSEMKKFIEKNMQYPEAEKQAGIQGTVYVDFVVEADGTITRKTISKGVPGGSGLEKEALRIVSIMPKWIPGISSIFPTSMTYSLPIKFTL